MSNIVALIKNAEGNPELQSRLENLRSSSPEEAKSQLSEVAQAYGVTLTEEDFATLEAASQTGEVPEALLEQVSGGSHDGRHLEATVIPGNAMPPERSLSLAESVFSNMTNLFRFR
jgi:hypothetical protein